ncbi:MAG: MerR family DNA-binding protein [Alphaproteobacteria bacterium]
MQLADVIQQSQLTEKAVRLYEAEGLIAPIKGGNGRRVYSDEDLARLKFLARARRLGFPLKDCRQLLELKSSDSWTADDVHQVAESHLRALESKMHDLEQMTSHLRNLLETCPAGSSQKCKVMFALSDDQKV